MNTTLRDVFTRRANEVGPADLDLDVLIGLGEHRLRRRRIVATVGAAVAVVLVVGIGVGGAVLNHSADSEPTNHPKNEQPGPGPRAERPLVYTDDTGGRPLNKGAVEIQVGAVHVGDRTVNIDQVSYYVRGWALRVTDDGVVYVQGDDNSVWFSDGGRPRQIGERNCFNPDHFGGIATGTTGSYAAWFDCTPASRGDLVVYDTAAGDEVARQTIPACRPRWSSCLADAVVGDHVYFTRMWSRTEGPGPRHDGRIVASSRMADLATGQVTPATPQTQSDDLRVQPRAIVLGDSWRSGTAETEVTFVAVGSRLVAESYPPDGNAPVRTQAFDTATGEPVRFRLPGGYHPGPSAGFHGDDPTFGPPQFTAFEWLDDNTVALVQTSEAGTGDILTCHVSDGRCRVAVESPPTDVLRMVPGASFPG